MATTRFLTADEFLRHPAAREASELVRGEIRMMTPAGGRHNVVAGRIYTALAVWVDAHALGQVFTDNLGYYLPIPGQPRDTVRAPDASFVRAEVLGGEIPIGFLRCAPDLAVEVRSPDDRPGALAERMADYRAAGTRCIWVVDPDARTVTVHRPDEAPDVVHADAAPDAALDGAPVLPGFTLPLAPLFAGLTRRG